MRAVLLVIASVGSAMASPGAPAKRATAMISEDDVRERLVGKRYAETTGWAGIPMLDCGMTALGSAGCEGPVDYQETHSITLTKRDVRVSTSLMTMPDGARRLIRCADAGKRPPRLLRDHRVRTRAYAPLASAPNLPLVVDAVTGVEIATPARDCAALANGRSAP